MAEIGIGMLGYAFMGKAHSNAFKTIEYMTWPPPLVPKLVGIVGRDANAVEEARERFGYEYATNDWREVVEDGRIGLFDNGGPNSLHAEPTIAAAQAGKHVVCEKPLGRDAGESYDIWQRVAATGVKHLCGFNYRFVPAVRLAREMIEAGELGEVRHFRARYLQDWGDDPSLDTWRFHADEAGSGALGDLGAHVVDLARFLTGEIVSVSGFAKTFLAGRTVDDAVEAAVEFGNGSVGTLEATRFAHGRRNAFQFLPHDRLHPQREIHVPHPAAGQPHQRLPVAGKRKLVNDANHPVVVVLDLSFQALATLQQQRFQGPHHRRPLVAHV